MTSPRFGATVERPVRVVVQLVAVGVALLLGCGRAAVPHNGSRDGYCENGVAFNVAASCGDCSDMWVVSPCSAGCSMGATPPPETEWRKAPRYSPAVTRFARCGEWSDPSWRSPNALPPPPAPLTP